MNWLEEYLARCAELGIERVERGTREFIAHPAPSFTESGPENGSKSQIAGGNPRRKPPNAPAQRDQSVTRTLL